MKTRSKILAVAIVAAAFALGAGCGSSYDCNQAAGKCSGDGAPTPQQLNQCNAWLNDANCGSSFRTYGTCILNNEECSDGGSGNFGAAELSCPNEYQAWQTCCSNHADAGACPLVL